MAHEQVQGLLQFLKESPTAFHAVESICSRLTGFEPLQENARWRLQPGGRYYVTRNRSSVIAFTVPQRGFAPFQLIASHTDSPTFRIKENAELTVRDKYVQLDVERYGGMILNTWLDRPLSVAGRLAVRSQDGVRSLLVNLDEDSAVIPNVAIHMNREVNKGVPYKANVDMLPICRTVQGEFEKNGYLVRQLAKRLQVQPEDVLSFELCAYCCAEPTLLGFEKDLLSSPRLDNLSSVHACLQGLADAQGDGINVAVLYDNEEIGSNTRRGADSSTLTVILEKLALSLGLDRTALLDACLNGMLLSCDAAHAMHPNHPEYADFSCAPVLGGGVALKRSPRYSSDAETCAVIQGLCDANQIPLQIYMNRADLPGGSTVGSMASSLLAMPAADIGIPILAMHSACETMGAADQDAFVRLCTAFFQA